MNYRQLELFCRTAEFENMTKAAEDLYISQPFLSRSLKALEEELGLKLFDRIGRNIYLNSCGKAFYNRINKIFNEIDDAVKEVRDMHNLQTERLRLVTNVSLYMPKLLKLLEERRPGLFVSQYSSQRNQIEKMIINGEVDFSICCPPLNDKSNFESIVLRFEPGVIIYPKGHWLENYDEIGLDDIKDESYINGAKGYGTREVVDLYMRENNTSVRTAIETADTSSVFKYVECGLGIAVMAFAPVLANPDFKDNYTRLKGGIGGTVSLVWRKDKYLNAADKLFIITCKEYFSGLDSI